MSATCLLIPLSGPCVSGRRALPTFSPSRCHNAERRNRWHSTRAAAPTTPNDTCVTSACRPIEVLSWPYDFHQRYKLLRKQLGQGSFGTVQLAVDKATGVEYAVKIIPKNAENSSRVGRTRGRRLHHLNKVKQEVSYLNVFKDCPFAVQLVGAHQDDDNAYIVQECLRGGSLKEVLSREGKFTEARAAEALFCILSFVQASHKRGIHFGDIKRQRSEIETSGCGIASSCDSQVPRGTFLMAGHLVDDRFELQRIGPFMRTAGQDRQPANFMLVEPFGFSGEGRLGLMKAIDFGCSSECPDGVYLRRVMGTPLYTAPEQFKKRFNRSADLWGVGVLLYQMLSGGEMPFWETLETLSMQEVMKGALYSDIRWSNEMRSSLSPEAKDLIFQLLRRDGDTRATAQSALQHAFITKHLGALPDLRACSEQSDSVVVSNIVPFSFSAFSHVPGRQPDALQACT